MTVLHESGSSLIVSCLTLKAHIFNFMPVFQTLYKTQVRELKEECEEKNKLYKDMQQSLHELQEERWVYRLMIRIMHS